MDLQGQRSPQTDIVIVSEDHPFTFTEELPGVFLLGWLHSVMPLMVRFEPIPTKYLIFQG